MTDVTVTSRLGDIEQYKNNPAKLQRASLETLRQITNGEINIVNATNPFVFALENSAVTTAGFIQQISAIHRRQYPEASVTQDDLYMHMSDKDYIGRFALPSKAMFTLMFHKEELLAALVTDRVTGIKKVTIPRNTVFKVADVCFSLQYPIDIRILTHGGLQVVYDASVVSPLQTLSTNQIIPREVYDPKGTAFIQLDVEATQFNIITKLNDVNAASGFKTTVALNDQFYHARVYVQLADSSWKEIKTTHSQQIYDPKVPTAVLKLLENKLSVVIPVIYTSTGLIRNKLRVDVYETKGQLSLALGSYKLEDFSVTWKAIDAADATVYSAPLRSLKTFVVSSESVVSGGRAQLSLDVLRNRVVQNTTGPQDLPITNVQRQTSQADAGYEIVKDVDTITNRIFLATKPMPKPADERLITAAASSIVTAILTFTQAGSAHGVIAHPFGITITPDVLYENVNGVTKLMTEASYHALMSMTKAQRCLKINASRLLYSPFHYVLDASKNSFDVRPYYLDTPKILSKSFVDENAATGLQVSVDATYMIERIATGYRLTISTKSSEEFRAIPDEKVYAQLSFKATGQTLRAYMLGVQRPRAAVTDERVYVFDMTTDFNISSSHQLDQTAFTFSPTALTSRSDLLQEMSICFATSKTLPAGIANSNVDNMLGLYQLPLKIVGITHEKLSVRFGYALTRLWAQGKSVVGSVPYQTHAVDVPRLYEKDEYATDAATGAAFSVDAHGVLTYRITHHKHDPVLDSLGHPTYSHRVGDPVLDAQGNPVPKANYVGEMIRQADITAIEGAYRFTTDSVSADYRNLITSSLVQWVTEDLEALSGDLLEQTQIYFHPKVSQGDVRVLTNDGLESFISASQSFTVTLSVPKSTYGNSLLLSAIKKATIKTIDTAIKNTTIAVSFIETALRNQYGSDVIDVKVQGLGGDKDLNVLTVIDKSNSLSIRKRLVALPDDQLIVEEDVQFVIHEHA